MTGKSTEDYDDGWNYIHDGDDANIDKKDDQNDRKTCKYYDFWVQIDWFQGLLQCEQGPKKFGQGPPSLIRAMPESNLFWGGRSSLYYSGNNMIIWNVHCLIMCFERVYSWAQDRWDLEPNYIRPNLLKPDKQAFRALRVNIFSVGNMSVWSVFARCSVGQKTVLPKQNRLLTNKHR